MYMSAHETEAAERLLRGLDADAVDIAKNQDYFDHLESFVHAYVSPEMFTVDDVEIAYTAANMISGLELGGMMLNVRQRRTQVGETSYDPDKFYAVAVGWLDSDKIPEFRFVPSHVKRSPDGKLIRNELLLDGTWNELEDKLVTDPSHSTLEQAEAILERQRIHNVQLAQTTRIVMTSEGRWLHLPGHVVHRLKPLDEALARVRLARERGFGRQATEQIVVTD